MKLIKYILSSLIILFLSESVSLSQKNLGEGNRYFDRNQFEDAIPFYQKEIEKGKYKYKNEAREKLAACYRLTGNFLEAAEIHKFLLSRSSQLNRAENTLLYANALKNGAQYDEAAEQFESYIKLVPKDPMGPLYFESCRMAQIWLDQEEKYLVKNFMGINSEEVEFSPTFYKDGIAFTSSREGSTKKFISSSDGIDENRTDIYFAGVGDQNVAELNSDMFDGVNSYLHDGTSTFNNDFTKIYFTRTILGEKDKKKNTILNSLQIFYSELNLDGEWSDPVSAFPFNDKSYSVFQPSLSKDGFRIYFVSDKSDGYGGTDIYYADMEEDGNWSEPVNLGNSVNTFGIELFPYIHSKDTLFFSSNTHPGMGKLDIFRVVSTNGVWGKPVNMELPINSIGDDFGIVMNENQTTGYFSSDRFDGMGKDDIYSLYKYGPQEIIIEGHLLKIPNHTFFSTITYKIKEANVEGSIVLKSEEGFYTYPLKEDIDYSINMRKDGFFYDEIQLKLNRDEEYDMYSMDIKSTNSDIKLEGSWVNAFPEDLRSRIDTLQTDDFWSLIQSSETSEIAMPGIELCLNKDSEVQNMTVTEINGNYQFSDKLQRGENYTIEVNKEDPEQFAIRYKKEEETIEDSLQNLLADEAIDTIVIHDSAEIFEAAIDSSQLVPPEDSLTKIIPPETYIFTGVIKSNEDEQGISDTDVKLFEDYEFKDQTITNNVGEFDFELEENTEYDVVATKEGYFQAGFEISGEEQDLSEGIEVEMKMDVITLDRTIKLENILFDLNKYNLNAEAKYELDRLNDFLVINPNARIQLNAHTDNNGNYYSNLLLSYKRAASSKNYLDQKGIDKNRIIIMGFGETFPAINNAKTDEDHKLNRRVEFRIIDSLYESTGILYNNIQLENPSVFTIMAESPYSKRQRFSVGDPLPSGTYYRILLKQSKTPLSYDEFDGIFPVVEELNRGSGEYYYYAGLFSNMNEASEAGKLLSSYGYAPIDIPVYTNGKIIVSDAVAENRSTNKTNRPSGTEIIAGSVPGSGSPEVPVFSIQVGAFKNPLRRPEINRFRKLADGDGLYNFKNKNHYIYSIGQYRNIEETERIKEGLFNKGLNKESFIIAFWKGERIPVREAILLLENMSSKDTESAIYNTANTQDIPDFCVQILALKSKANKTTIKELENLAGEYTLNIYSNKGYIIYTVGNFNTVNEASRAKEIMIDRGAEPNIFVSAILNGKRIAVQEAVELRNISNKN